MINEPLVSVGIPCYERPEGLRRTLECITGQTYRNLEIIVSDNCSTDPEVERISRSFASDDNRVRYVRQPQNNGMLFNFKYVLSQATGKYFMWASDDDLWDSNYVNSLFSAINNHSDSCFAFSNIVNIDLDDNTIREYPSFSRFNSKRKWFTICSLFLEPEIMGKANITYSIFPRKLLLDIIDSECIDNFYWGFDNALVLGAFARGDFFAIDEVLLKKRIPLTADKDGYPKMIVINGKYKHSVPISKFIGYTRNCILATKGTRYVWLVILCSPLKFIISVYGFISKALNYVFFSSKGLFRSS